MTQQNLTTALASLLPGWSVAHRAGETDALLRAPDGKQYTIAARMLYLVAGLCPEGCGPHSVNYGTARRVTLEDLRALSRRPLPLLGYTVHYRSGFEHAEIRGVLREESDAGHTGGVEYECRYQTALGWYRGTWHRDRQGLMTNVEGPVEKRSTFQQRDAAKKGGRRAAMAREARTRDDY